LLKAIDKLDAVIKVIRASASPQAALIELVGNRNLKFTGNQARAILEMKLRSLTNLDSEELTAELTELAARLEALKVLIQSEAARSKYMLSEIKAISKKFGEPRRSSLIDIPEGFAKQNEPGQPRIPSVSKPRFVKIDLEKGIVTQEKGPRGCLLLETTDKLITITQNGTIKKLPANFKGTLDVGYIPVLLGQKESKVVTSSYLVVFKLEENLKAMVVSGKDLARTTSKGKNLLAPGAELMYFGEKPHTVNFVSGRKKPVVLTLETKQGKPGGKGIKIANLADVQLQEAGVKLLDEKK